MNVKDGDHGRGDSGNDGRSGEAQALATAGPKAPSRTEWLRHLRKALAGQEKEGDRTNIRLAALGPLHDRMQAGVDDEVLRVLAPALKQARAAREAYNDMGRLMFGSPARGKLYSAFIIYRAVLDGLEEQQRIDQERVTRKTASLRREYAAKKAAASAAAASEATAPVQLPSVPPPPPQPAPPKLPLSYTYCFHPAADTWVPASRAATAAAPSRAKTAKTLAPRQQEAGGRRSIRHTNCHATADSLWISTPQTYSYDAAADTWLLPAAPPAAAAATAAQGPAVTAAATKGVSGIGGGSSMRYSHFTGGWVQTQPAADAELPADAKQRCARCTYQYDTVSDAWVCSAAPVAAAAKAMAAPAAGGSCSTASHLCTTGGWLPASSKVYSFGAASDTWVLPDSPAAAAIAASPGSTSASAAAHIPTADGWLPAPPTYSYDPVSGSWALRSGASAVAAAAPSSAAPAAATTPAADSAAAASAFEQAAAAVAFAQAPSPPAFLAFARRGSPCSRAASAEQAAGAAAVAAALSPPAALAFARRGSPTSRAATTAAAKPAAAQAILLPPPPPQQHGSRTYAYDAAEDAWFCPTLDYGRDMPTVCKQLPAEQQAAANLEAMKCCPYKRVAALMAAIDEPLKRLGGGVLLRQQVRVQETAFHEAFAPLCGCAVCKPRVAAEAEVQRDVLRLAKEKLLTLWEPNAGYAQTAAGAAAAKAADIIRTMHALAKDAETGDCSACDVADALMREVWLADAQALLDAATDGGAGADRTVRYLQTAVEDIAGALRRAWRLQPEALAELDAGRTGTAETTADAAVPGGSCVAAAAAPAGSKLAGIKYGAAEAPAPAALGAAAAAAAAVTGEAAAAARWAEALRKLSALEVSPDRADFVMRLQRAFTACQVRAASTKARIPPPPPPPLKTAGIKWGPADVDADTEDAAAAAPAAAAPQPPLQIAGIKWGVPLQPETALQEDAAKESTDEEPSSVAPPWTAAPAVAKSPLPYRVACGTPAALFAHTPAAAAELTPTTDGELPAADAAAAKLTAALESLMNVPQYAQQGSECGDAAVIIAEDEAGAAGRSGPTASFLADVEAKLAAAAGGHAGSSDDEWVHCAADASDAAEGISSDDEVAEMDD